MKKCKIHGLGEPFDGLIVHVEDASGTLFGIRRIESKHHLFDSFSLPIGDGLYIDGCNIEEYDDEEIEQLSGNPFGEYVRDQLTNVGGMSILMVEYENAVSVSVTQDGSVIYSHCFMGSKYQRDSVIELLGSNGGYDFDNISFDLKELE